MRLGNSTLHSQPPADICGCGMREIPQYGLATLPAPSLLLPDVFRKGPANGLQDYRDLINLVIIIVWKLNKRGIN